MGYYINPRNMSKEQFLENLGIRVTLEDFKNCNFSMLRKDGDMMVVLVDNGMFTAALICYSHEEYEYMRNNPDPRRKTYYLVEEKNLTEFLVRG